MYHQQPWIMHWPPNSYMPPYHFNPNNHSQSSSYNLNNNSNYNQTTNVNQNIVDTIFSNNNQHGHAHTSHSGYVQNQKSHQDEQKNNL